MTGTEILNYIQPEMFILIPVLIVFGLILKSIPNIKDWTIPIVLGILGVIIAILIVCLKKGFEAENILNGILQGILCAGMAVYVHQLTIQSTRKRKEDQV